MKIFASPAADLLLCPCRFVVSVMPMWFCSCHESLIQVMSVLVHFLVTVRSSCHSIHQFSSKPLNVYVVGSCRWDKMIFRILLLISFISCVSASLVVNVAQTYYQAEQNHSITLEWTFTPKPDTSITSVYVYCDLVTDLRDSVLFHLHEGVEASESQDQQFSGRVQFDKDVLREGRLRLQLSRLRTDDSGRYECSIRTSDGWNVGRCRLNVTAAADQPETQRPDVRRQPEDPQQGTRLYSGLMLMLILILMLILMLGLVAVVTVALLAVYSCFERERRRTRTQFERIIIKASVTGSSHSFVNQFEFSPLSFMDQQPLSWGYSSYLLFSFLTQTCSLFFS